MRNSVIALVVVTIVIAATVLWQVSTRASMQVRSLDDSQGLPWQIEMIAGNPRVFGLTIGQSRLADVAARLGDDHEVAIIEDSHGEVALEIYASRFSAGKLTGSLIVVAGASREDLDALRKKVSPGKKYLETGSSKTEFRFDDRHYAYGFPVKNITFIPVAPLSREMIENFFGKADYMRETDENVVHYLYRAKGLEIILNRKGRDFLQYMPRDEMDNLVATLKKASR